MMSINLVHDPFLMAEHWFGFVEEWVKKRNKKSLIFQLMNNFYLAQEIGGS